jgi:hypothetical protein
MVTANTPQPSRLFGAYQQVGDLDRTLSFYGDVLAPEVVWSDGALVVLHGHRAGADSLVIREIVDAYTRRSAQLEAALDHHRPDPCPTRT